MLFSALPEPQGLYDPANESDSCGVAMVTASMSGITARAASAYVAESG